MSNLFNGRFKGGKLPKSNVDCEVGSLREANFNGYFILILCLGECLLLEVNISFLQI